MDVGKAKSSEGKNFIICARDLQRRPLLFEGGGNGEYRLEINKEFLSESLCKGKKVQYINIKRNS